jgi:hypothetical protein
LEGPCDADVVCPEAAYHERQRRRVPTHFVNPLDVQELIFTPALRASLPVDNGYGSVVSVWYPQLNEERRWKERAATTMATFFPPPPDKSKQMHRVSNSVAADVMPEHIFDF